jgi:hypothetical protein
LEAGRASVGDQARRQVATLIFAAGLISLFFLDHPAPGWGANSRLALVFAVVERGTFAIDAYYDKAPTQTYDIAHFEGHYYSDKIIGVSLLALPVYAVMHGVGSWVGWEPDFTTSNHVLRMFAVSLPAAFSLVLLWLLMLKLGAPPRRALVAVGIAFWGSLWYGFSSAFFPYSAGIAAILGALWLLISRPLDSRRSLGVGALCGFAILCDMIFGLVVIGVGAVYLVRLQHDLGFRAVDGFGEPNAQNAPSAGPAAAPLSRAASSLALGSLGGLLPLSIFVAYSISIFGTPTIPYEYEYLREFREPMARGFMGIEAPKPGALWFLTLHPYRGIFFWSPWLCLALAGLGMGLRAGGLRRLCAALGTWGLVSYLIFNSGYYMWWAGYGMGSRFLLPIFAVVPLGLAELLRAERSSGWFWSLVSLGAISIALSAPLSILEPETPVVNDYFLLLNATLDSQLLVPQFEYLRAFYSPDLFWIAGEGLSAEGIFNFTGAVLLPLALLVAAGRSLPAEPTNRSGVPSVALSPGPSG